MSSKHLVPTSPDLGLLMLRLVVGVTFAFHGAQKLFGAFGGGGIDGTATFFGEQLQIPFPTLSAVLAGGAEFFGGLSFVVGFGSRLLALPLVFTMLVAGFTAHGDAFALQQGGMEYTLVLAAAALCIGLAGPGRFAFDPMKKTKKES